jgi:hypothetical protein
MGTRLRGVCDAFEVTVDEPARGARDLNINVLFVPGGPTDRAKINLRLYSRTREWVIRKKAGWDLEAHVPGTLASLERGATGQLRFTRPLPAFVASYSGRDIEITPVLVTEGDDGSKVRLQLDIPLVAEDAWLVVRGLPRSEQVRATGLTGLLRGRRFRVRLEEARRGTINLTVEGPRPLSAGRARLRAVEFTDDSESPYTESEPPIVATDTTLVAAGSGMLRGELTLPDATAAPASLSFSGGTYRQGIRWAARLELDDEDGDVAQVEVPLDVGVERDG